MLFHELAYEVVKAQQISGHTLADHVFETAKKDILEELIKNKDNSDVLYQVILDVGFILDNTEGNIGRFVELIHHYCALEPSLTYKITQEPIKGTNLKIEIRYKPIKGE